MNLGMETVALCQQKAQERKAAEYIAKNQEKREMKELLKTALLLWTIIFLIIGFKIVGDNDLESLGIVLAKETETETLPVTHTMAGNIDFGGLIETKDGMLWQYDTEYVFGTEVNVYFNDNGTTNPLDDVVLDVKER